MSSRRPRLAVLALLIGLVAGAARAGETRVAVAANFTVPAQAIAARFRAVTGHTAVLGFGSTGQIYAQIVNGAPYEVFLSADDERPARLEAAGRAAAGGRFTYATGRLVLFSQTPGRVDARGAVLAAGRFDKLAIADPQAAPYGRAAVETLRGLKLQDRLKPKLVTGASVTQALQYVRTGAAELGLVALSQVIDTPGGSRWLVPSTLHAPIDQQAVLLKTGADNPAAQAFVRFLRSGEAKAIIRRSGYEAP